MPAPIPPVMPLPTLLVVVLGKPGAEPVPLTLPQA